MQANSRQSEEGGYREDPGVLFFFWNIWQGLPEDFCTTIDGSCLVLNPMLRHPYGRMGSQVTKKKRHL